MSVDYRSICFKHHPNECTICGAEEELVAHHVDGNRSNNSPDNLRPLCPSCHVSIHNHERGFEEWSAKLPETVTTTRNVHAGPLYQIVDWLTPCDLTIMRYLALCFDLQGNRAVQTPKTIAVNTSYSRHHIGNRCRTLMERGLVERVGEGEYVLGEKGAKVVDEDIDPVELMD